MVNPILLLCVLTWLGSLVGVAYATFGGCTVSHQDIPVDMFQRLLELNPFG